MDFSLQLAISGVSALMSGIIAYFGWKLKKRDAEREKKTESRIAEHNALCTGMQAILRNGIIQAYNHRCEKGWAPFYEVENVTNMYMAYHDLGGNGAVTEIYHKFMNLPQQPPEEKG